MRHTFRKTTAIFMAALCAVSVLAMTSCDDSTASLEPVESDYVVPVPEDKIDATVKGDQLTGKVGDEITYQDKIVFKVDAVRELDRLRSDTNRILFFEVTVTNNSDQELDLSFLTHFSVRIGDSTVEAGHSAVANQQATRYYYDQGLALLHEPVPAKQDATEEKPNTVKGIVPFALRADWTELELVYMPMKYTANDEIIVTVDEASIQHIADDSSADGSKAE